MTTLLDDKPKKRNVDSLYAEHDGNLRLRNDFTGSEYGRNSYTSYPRLDIGLNSVFRSSDLDRLHTTELRNSKGSHGSPQCSVVSVEDQTNISRLPPSIMEVNYTNNLSRTGRPPPSSSFPGLNTSKWSRTEHEAFLKGLRTHGKDWNLVSSVVETRTPLETQIHADEFFLKTSRMTCMGGAKRGSSSALNRLASSDTSSTRADAPTATARRDIFSSQESATSSSQQQQQQQQPEKICWDKIVFAPSSTPMPAQQKQQTAAAAVKLQASSTAPVKRTLPSSSQSPVKQQSSPVKSAPETAPESPNKRTKMSVPSASGGATALPYSFDAIMQMINSPLFAALLAQYPQLASMMAATVAVDGDGGQGQTTYPSSTIRINNSNSNSNSSGGGSNNAGGESGVKVISPTIQRPISTASSVLPLGQVSTDPYFRHMYPLSVPPVPMAQLAPAPIATPAMAPVSTALCGNPLLDMPYIPAAKLHTALSVPNIRSNMNISTAFNPYGDMGGMYGTVPPVSISHGNQQRGVSKVTPLASFSSSSSSSSSSGGAKAAPKRQASPPPRRTVGVLNHRYEEELLAAQMLSNLCSAHVVSATTASAEAIAPRASAPVAAGASAGAPAARIIPIGSVFASSLLPAVADIKSSNSIIGADAVQPVPEITAPPTSITEPATPAEPAPTEPVGSDAVNSASTCVKAEADAASVSNSTSETPSVSGGGGGGGASGKSKKYRHLTLADKYEIVQKVRYYDLEARSAKSVCNMHQAVARDYGVCESTVYQIVRRQDDIERKYFEQVQTGVVDGEQQQQQSTEKDKDHSKDEADTAEGSSNNNKRSGNSKENEKEMPAKVLKKSGRKPGRFLSSPAAKESAVGRE